MGGRSEEVFRVGLVFIGGGNRRSRDDYLLLVWGEAAILYTFPKGLGRIDTC
jgi:hypothetical protein